MSETQLLNLLNHYLIREFQEKGLEGMCTNEFLPLCAALVFPYRNERIDLIKNVIPPIITSVRNFTRKKDLARYNLQGLRFYFKVNWLPKLSFEEQKQLLSCVSLIVKIEDTGYFSIKDNEKVHNAYLNLKNLPDISHNYGKEYYETVPSTPTESNSTISCESQTAHPVNQLEDTTLFIEKQPIEKGAQKQKRPKVHNREMKSNKPTENHPFCELYNKLLQKRGDAPTYTWQWLLTKDEYEKIQRCVANNANAIPSPSNMKPCIAKLLVLYLGEYFKREYDGEKAPIKLKPQQLDKVIELAGIPLYKSDKDRNAKLHSIYVYGGLQVHHIATKKPGYLIKALRHWMHDDSDCGDILNASNHSIALKQSFNQNQSIYTYVSYLMNEQRVWAQSDDNEQDFSNFKAILAGHKDKLGACYYLYSTDKDLLIQRVLTLRPEYNNEEGGARHYAISKDRLATWGVGEDLTHFTIILYENKAEILKIYFNICCNGDYIEFSERNEFKLPWLSNFHWSDVAFDVQNGANRELRIEYENGIKDIIISKQLPTEEKGYVQFYTDDEPKSGQKWVSTKGKRKYRYSGLLYDTTKWKCNGKATIINDAGWVVFDEQIDIYSIAEGKYKTFINKSEIEVRSSDFVNLLQCPIIKCWEFLTKDNDTITPYIICKNPSFTAFDVRSQEEIDSQKLSITYQIIGSGSTQTWQSYNVDTQLYSGLIDFKVEKKDASGNILGSTIVHCLMLKIKEKPSIANILKVNTENKFIRCNIEGLHQNDVSATLGNTTLEVSASPHEPNKIKIKDNPNGQCQDIKIEINFGGNTLSLTTYRPVNEAFITNLSSSKVQPQTIPIIFADKYIITRINADNGYLSRISEKEEINRYLLDYLAPCANTSGVLDKYDLNNIAPELGENNYVVAPYTKELDLENSENIFSDNNMFFLTFKDNQLTEIKGSSDVSAIQGGGKEGLLFQSLEDVSIAVDYYAPKYISGKKNEPKIYEESKISQRQSRIRNNINYIQSKSTCKQFEIACLHKLYFAVFDQLLAICWNDKKNTILDLSIKKEFKTFEKNALTFLKAYIGYSENPDIEGLNRLAREFCFSWKKMTIPKALEQDSDFQYIYQQLH